MSNTKVNIGGATLPKGLFEYGPWTINPEVSSLFLEIDITNFLNPLSKIKIAFKVSYDAGITWEDGGSAELSGGILILDEGPSTVWTLEVSLSALKNKENRQVKMFLEVINGSAIIGPSSLKLVEPTAVIAKE